ncbi:MAG: hypothetical protein HKM93_09840 [Desulfobacteraceae bacterium]|nr:hypothetical protein [Desulfobacteraceae bacterium]
MKSATFDEQIIFRMVCLPRLGNLELLKASYGRHVFNRHFHERYAVGVIEAGALGYHYRGKDIVAAPGDINLAIPGEAHDGFAANGQGLADTYDHGFLRSVYFHGDVADRPETDLGNGGRDTHKHHTGGHGYCGLYYTEREIVSPEMGCHRHLGCGCDSSEWFSNRCRCIP